MSPRLLLSLLMLALGLVVAGCSAPAGPATQPPSPSETPPVTKDPGAVVDEKPLPPSPPPEPEGGSAAEGPVGKAEGAACLASVECASGTCEGQGCGEGAPGTCVARSRPCTKDLRQYCSCDGKTFSASGTCPGRRFAARAPCGS